MRRNLSFLAFLAVVVVGCSVIARLWMTHAASLDRVLDDSCGAVTEITVIVPWFSGCIRFENKYTTDDREAIQLACSIFADSAATALQHFPKTGTVVFLGGSTELARASMIPGDDPGFFILQGRGTTRRMPRERFLKAMAEIGAFDVPMVPPQGGE